jgi:hypothetical protein
MKNDKWQKNVGMGLGFAFLAPALLSYSKSALVQAPKVMSMPTLDCKENLTAGEMNKAGTWHSSFILENNPIWQKKKKKNLQSLHPRVITIIL